MIPQIQLESLKPLPDQLNREKMVHSKRHSSFKKQRLTKRARQWANFHTGSNPLINKSKYKGPHGKKSYGNLPMSERKK